MRHLNEKARKIIPTKIKPGKNEIKVQIIKQENKQKIKSFCF